MPLRHVHADRRCRSVFVDCTKIAKITAITESEYEIAWHHATADAASLDTNAVSEGFRADLCNRDNNAGDWATAQFRV